MKKHLLNLFTGMLTIILFSAFNCHAQSISGDLKFWQKSDLLGFDQVGDCKGPAGDISSVFARVNGDKLLLRITFDDMVSRKHNALISDNFQGKDIQLVISLVNKKEQTGPIRHALDLSKTEYRSGQVTVLRTPVYNLWEAEINLGKNVGREDLEYDLEVVDHGIVTDTYHSGGGPADAVGNCAFVHHGNQGLTYTQVFYGNPAGVSGLDGSGFDEILQAHEATSIPGNFHMSGTLMPAAEWHNPEFNAWLASLVSQGRIEMMTSGLGQHIMPFVHNNMNDWSVSIESDMVEFMYNYVPRTAWVPERVWLAQGSYPNAGVIDWPGDNWTQHGVWGVVLDDSPHLNGYDNRKIHWMNNGSGISLRVIPINNSFVGNMMYNADGAKNQIASMGTYNICVYGTDWEVASEMNEHDGSFFLDNYENVLWWCHDNYPGVNVWKLSDAIQNPNFNGTGAEITPGTYGLLGGGDGYGGSNNSWYTQWAGTASHSDFHDPKWNYGYIWNDAYNNLMTAPDNGLSQLGWYILMINLHETGWHEGGTVASWEHRYSSHIKNANVYAEAARWAAGQYQSPLAAYYNDIDHDGIDEVVIHNQKVFAVFESIGGKANWLFYKDGIGNAYSVVGSDMAYWSETDGDYNDGSNNHVAALSDVYPNQQNAIYQINIFQSFGDTVRVNFSQWGVSKTVELVEDVTFLDVIYDFYGSDGYIKSGWSPGLLDIIWSGKSHLQRMWGSYGSYCGYRNSSSGATAAIIFGNGGAQHNTEFEGTLVKGDEIKGNNQFKIRLFAGYTSPPTGTTVPELNTLAGENMDVFPPTLNNIAFQVDNNTIELIFNEAVDFGSAQNEDNYSLQGFSNNYTISNVIRQTDWRKVRLTIMEYWVPGDAGQVLVENVMDMNGNVIGNENTATLTIPAGTTPHTIYIDGTNDFDAANEFMDTDQYSLYLTWDNENLFIGFYSLNLNGGGDLFVNIDTDQVTGSGAGTDSWGRVAYTSKYRAEYQVAIEGGGGSIQLNHYANGLWHYPSNNNCQSYEGWSGNGLTEIAVPWASMGNPSKLAISVHVTQEDNHIVTASFPPENPTGNHPTLTHVYAFYIPYIVSEMPVIGMVPNQVFVLPNQPPVINSYLPVQLNQTVETGGTIDFSVNATDPENEQLYYSWLLDDQPVAQTQAYNFIASPGMTGLHQVSATVTDGVPGNTSNPVNWQVEVIPGTQLIPGFTVNITTACLGNTLQFTDQSNGPVSSWLWEFEGGTPPTSTAQHPAVTYQMQGIFDVTITISDGTNTQALTKTDYITVHQNPTVLAGNDITICDDQPAQLSGSATQYSAVLWTSAGDGVFSNAFSLTPVYTPGTADRNSGHAELSLTAFPISPCPASVVDVMIIDINLSPQITLQPVSQSVYTGQDVMFEIAVTGTPIIDYQWYGPGGIMEDETGFQLILQQVELSDAGNYYCVVSNECGEETSLTAMLTVMETPQQIIQIPDGWSGISAYLDLVEPMMETVFEEIVLNNDLVVVQNFSWLYWPAQQINTIDINGGWNVKEGYQAKIVGDQTLLLTGYPPENRNLDYTEAGWYLLPVLNECGIAPQALFSDIIDDVVIVKEIAGIKVFWPGVFQNLLLLEPGKAYMAKFSAPVSFAYPVCELLKTQLNFSEESFSHNDVKIVFPNPYSHVFVLKNGSFPGSLSGKKINIVTGGGFLLAGIEISDPSESIGFQVFADDPTTVGKDGFEEGDEMEITLSEDEHIVKTILSFDERWGNNQLKINGMTLITSVTPVRDSSMDDTDNELVYYPNPANEILFFDGLGISPCRVDFFGTDGRKVLSTPVEEKGTKITALRPGLYYFIIYQGDRSFYGKFIKN